MTKALGRVRRRRGGKPGFEIDFGRAASPRFLYSASGAPLRTREFAEQILSAIRTRVAQGADLQRAVDEWAPAASERNGVEYWTTRYLAEAEQRAATMDLSPNTLRDYRRFARSGAHLWSWWYGRSIHEIGAATLNEWRLLLSQPARGLAPKTVKNVLDSFRTFVRWLCRMELLDREPSFPRIKVPDYTPKLLSADEQESVLARIPYERRGAFLAACLGIRPSEVRALSVDDCQTREDTQGIVVARALKGPNANAPAGPTKTGCALWIPISTELERWVEWRLTQRRRALGGEFSGTAHACWSSPALFPNPSARRFERRWIANALREEWNRAAESVGMKVRMYEGTKHSSATAWLGRGMRMEVVQRMLRHRDRRSTERYAKLTDSSLVDALSRVRRCDPPGAKANPADGGSSPTSDVQTAGFFPSIWR